MPNPLSKVRSSGNVMIANSGDYPLSRHPKLAILAMECIGSWSNVESFLMRFYVTLAGGNGSDAAALYLSLETSSAKSAAVQTLALRKLPEDQQKLLRAILDVAKRRQGERDRLAHWTWGECPELPDCLLLVDPRAAAALDFESADYGKQLRELCLVYKEADFRDLLSGNERLCGYAGLFHRMISNPRANHEGRIVSRLSEEPEIADRLGRQGARG